MATQQQQQQQLSGHCGFVLGDLFLGFACAAYELFGNPFGVAFLVALVVGNALCESRTVCKEYDDMVPLVMARKNKQDKVDLRNQDETRPPDYWAFLNPQPHWIQRVLADAADRPAPFGKDALYYIERLVFALGVVWLVVNAYAIVSLVQSLVGFKLSVIRFVFGDAIGDLVSNTINGVQK